MHHWSIDKYQFHVLLYHQGMVTGQTKRMQLLIEGSLPSCLTSWNTHTHTLTHTDTLTSPLLRCFYCNNRPSLQKSWIKPFAEFRGSRMINWLVEPSPRPSCPYPVPITTVQDVFLVQTFKLIGEHIISALRYPGTSVVALQNWGMMCIRKSTCARNIDCQWWVNDVSLPSLR